MEHGCLGLEGALFNIPFQGWMILLPIESKRKKLVNSDNEGRRESEEEEVEKNEDNMKKKGAKFKRSHELLSQLMFDRVELVNSQKGGVQSFFL